MNEGGVNIFGSFFLYAQLFFEGIGNPSFNNLIFLCNIVPLALNVYIPGVQWSVKYSSPQTQSREIRPYGELQVPT